MLTVLTFANLTNYLEEGGIDKNLSSNCST